MVHQLGYLVNYEIYWHTNSKQNQVNMRLASHCKLIAVDEFEKHSQPTFPTSTFDQR